MKAEVTYEICRSQKAQKNHCQIPNESGCKKTRKLRRGKKRAELNFDESAIANRLEHDEFNFENIANLKKNKIVMKEKNKIDDSKQTKVK